MNGTLELTKQINDTENISVGEFGIFHWLPAIKKKRRSWKLDERLFTKQILPVLGDKLIANITSVDIGNYLDILENKHFSESTRNRILYVLKSLLKSGIEENFLDHDLRDLFCGFFTPQKRKNQAFITSEKIKLLGATLKQSDSLSARAIELLLLTGASKREILGARWDDLDIENNILKVNGYAEKTRNICLGPKTLKVIQSIPRQGDSPWIFPARNPARHISDIYLFWNDLRKTCGLEKYRIQDLKHNYVNWESRGRGYSLALEKEIWHQVDLADKPKCKNCKEDCAEFYHQVAIAGISSIPNIFDMFQDKQDADFINPAKENEFFHVKSTATLRKEPNIHELLKQITNMAIENSPYSIKYLQKRLCGVYCALENTALNLFYQQSFIKGFQDANFEIECNAASYIKHLYKLTGPAVCIDAGEISFLTAAHQACENIRHKYLEFALVFGLMHFEPSPLKNNRTKSVPIKQNIQKKYSINGIAILLMPYNESIRKQKMIFASIMDVKVGMSEFAGKDTNIIPDFVLNADNKDYLLNKQNQNDIDAFIEASKKIVFDKQTYAKFKEGLSQVSIAESNQNAGLTNNNHLNSKINFDNP